MPEIIKQNFHFQHFTFVVTENNSISYKLYYNYEKHQAILPVFSPFLFQLLE